MLLVGSGLMTPPLIDYLLAFNDTHITVASNMLTEAQSLCKRAPNSMDAVFLDVANVSRLTNCRSPLSQSKLKDTIL